MDDILEQAERDLLTDDNHFPLNHYLRILDVAVSDPFRFSVIHTLYTADDGMSVNELRDTLEADGDDIQQHLNIIMDAGLATTWTSHDSQTGTYRHVEITGTGHTIHEAVTHLINVEQDASEQFRSDG